MTKASGQTIDVWGGDFPSDDITVATNWANQVVPAGLTAGSDVLMFNTYSNQYLDVTTSAVSFNQIRVFVGADYQGASGFIYGSNYISIGSGGILLQSAGDSLPSLTLTNTVNLTANQTWTGTGTGGSITVQGPITGTGPLTLIGNGNFSFELDASSTFSGGLTVSGDYTTLYVGATSSPFGTGPLHLGDGTYVEPTTPSPITVPNSSVTFGDSTVSDVVLIGGYQYANSPTLTSVTFTGNAIFNINGLTGSDSEVDLTPYTTVTFTGNLSGGTPGVCLDFGTVGSGQNALVILQGSFGSNISRFDLEDNISVILDGTGVSQFTNLADIGTGQGTYLGFGKGYVGSVASALATTQIGDPSYFQGTLGFDTTSGTESNFSDTIDLTHFTNGSFVGLGSATHATLSGTIIPPNGLGTEFGTTYQFGGGGGKLTVTSALTDSSWYDGEVYVPEPNALLVSPGNAPLTLVLSGPLSYSGGTTVNGAALIFDTPPNASNGSINLGYGDAPQGYVGSTLNSGYLNDDTGAAGTHPQDFIKLVQGDGSVGVVGFDTFSGPRTISGAISLTSYPDVFLGTATSVTYAGTIQPWNSTFMFSGVKGGQVTVTSPSISGEDSVVIGLASPMESNGSVSSVTLPGPNYYSGTTTLNSGYLYVGTANSIGFGNLNVTGPTDDGTGTFIGLAPSGADVLLSNNITVPYEGLHLNVKNSPYTLILAGVIANTEYNGSLIVDGPVELDGANSFTGSVTVNGTTLTLGNDYALSYNSSGITATTGSTINFPTQFGYTPGLTITGTTVNFTYAGGSPEIDSLDMISGSTINFAAGSTPYIGGMSSDLPNSGNVINLGNGETTYLQFDLVSDPDFHGTIVGNGNVELVSGTLNLTGANTYNAGTLIDSNATLIASNNSAFGTGPVTVYGTVATNTGIAIANPITLEDGATVAGYGSFTGGGTLVFQNGSTLVPGTVGLQGDGPGTLAIPPVGSLSFSGGTSFTFGPGGNFEFGINDANGSPGVGYSSASIDGTLNITATPATPFNIVVTSFTPGSSTPNSDANNFNATLNYSWTLLATSGPITNFSPADFTINASQFSNALGTGGFYVSISGDDLTLNFTPVPEPSTWVLMASGVCALGAALRRRRRA